MLNLINEFNFCDQGYDAKAFKSIKIIKSGDSKKTLTITKEKFLSELMPDLIRKLKELKIENLELDQNQRLFDQTLISFFEGVDTEISPKFKNVYGNFYSNAKVVKTKLGLDLKTQQYIDSDWNVMYAVAETGEWLLDKIKEKKFEKKEK